MTAYTATFNQAIQQADAGVRRLAPSHQWLKRGLDVALVLAAAAVFLPLIGLAALAIQLVDRGPVFYAQVRRGLGGRRIRVWKLRTMYQDSAARLERHLAENPAAREEWNRFFKLRHDPRVLPWIGGLLRRSSIDELPQVWNLLVGEMTLVGPRPLPDYHLAAFDGAFRHQRQTVTPGLTGLWQVAARSDGDAMVMRRLDGFYIANRSIGLDLLILLRTVAVVLAGRGAR